VRWIACPDDNRKVAEIKSKIAKVLFELKIISAFNNGEVDEWLKSAVC
jgi:hypothetical protein